MGLPVDTYLSQLKSEKVKGLKKKILAVEKSTKAEEVVSVPAVLKIDSPLSSKTFEEKEE
jgi:hypothetical protein